MLALNCRLQVEQDNVMESVGGPWPIGNVFAFSALSFSITDSLLSLC